MNNYDYIIALSLSFLLTALAVPAVIWLAKKVKAIDYPDSERKIHKTPTPLLGGLAIFFVFNILLLFYALVTKSLTGDTITLRNLIGISVGTLFLMLGGILDDKFNLRPHCQFIWPILAIASVVICGIGIDWVTNPFGKGLVYLDKYEFNLFWYHGFPYKITLLADIFTFFWLLAMIYTTKLLDGLDGLVSGVAIIGAIFIFLTSLNKGEIVQYDVALLAIIIAGIFAGFLVFNFHPASIFLGEGGSTLAGFLLGSLSIVSGSKVGVTLMLMSIPALDVLWTIIRRWREKKSPFSFSDKEHLHFRLLAAGFSVKKAVLFFYAIAVIFGLLAYYLQEFNLALLFIAIVAVVVFLLILRRLLSPLPRTP
jgi:UDP-GlcNAc:undecaprenyl-phosphate GlcNAc-1-phosphate transferase